MSADNVIVLSFSILFVIYAVIEIINIVSNIKVKILILNIGIY